MERFIFSLPLCDIHQRLIYFNTAVHLIFIFALSGYPVGIHWAKHLSHIFYIHPICSELAGIVVILEI